MVSLAPKVEVEIGAAVTPELEGLLDRVEKAAHDANGVISDAYRLMAMNRVEWLLKAAIPALVCFMGGVLVGIAVAHEVGGM